jgi:acyl-CoA thioester hydrolase
MSKKDFAFHHHFRVRFSETDGQGIVFNARYLDYADIAITEYWRAARFHELAGDAPLDFNIKKATVTWFAPIRPDEMIEVMARTMATGRTSITQLVEIHGFHQDGRDDLRAVVELVSVHVDLTVHRPAPLPDWIAPHFAKFDGAVLQSGEPV